jgi:hypothetical protein
MKITSAPNLVQVSLNNSIVSGRPPRFFESQSRAKGALLVGSNPDEEPVGRLDAGGERGADAGAGADADAAGEHGGSVAYAG